MSLPRLSVPSQCRLEGAWLIAPGLIAVGEYGASQGLAIATNAHAATIAAPAISSVFRRPADVRRKPGRRTFACPSALSPAAGRSSTSTDRFSVIPASSGR